MLRRSPEPIIQPFLLKLAVAYIVALIVISAASAIIGSHTVYLGASPQQKAVPIVYTGGR